ncbi:MAG TPA: helix-turn-helix domain-containing protein [Ktedonobacterales bacterium]|jgi:excisionase family DNA binding protein|nr:helix-turn-helix domain-containing protein [Ktedonobacterales bacterium]
MATMTPLDERMPGEPLLLDLNAVAFLLSLSRAEVEREIARGALSSVKRGRRRLVTRSQLERYVERLERMSA